MLLASLPVRNEEVRFHIVAFDFFADLVRAVLGFILDVEDGTDKVFALQRPDAILPPESREHRTVAESSLAVQVELRGPPSGCTVFERNPVGEEVVAASLGAIGREILDLEVAGLFEIVIIGDKVRPLLGMGRRWKENREYGNEEKARQDEPTQRDHGISLQVICNSI